MIKNKYFVSYSHSAGTGCCTIEYSDKIKNMLDIKKIKEILEKEKHINKVVIMNIQKMPI